jgi:hypothetical protein
MSRRVKEINNKSQRAYLKFLATEIDSRPETQLLSRLIPEGVDFDQFIDEVLRRLQNNEAWLRQISRVASSKFHRQWFSEEEKEPEMSNGAKKRKAWK